MYPAKPHGGLLNKSTIPRTSIDLIAASAEIANRGKQESNDDTVNNIQSEMTTSLKMKGECADVGSLDDANMDSASESNFIYQSYMMNKEMGIGEVKQSAIRKFIDSENDENLYVLHDGSLYTECIKTSKTK